MRFLLVLSAFVSQVVRAPACGQDGKATATVETHGEGPGEPIPLWRRVVTDGAFFH